MSGAWVIFEGPDGAGKSSLADRTCRHLADTRGPAILQHLTSHSEFDEYYGPPSLWSRSGLNVVQDRCAISDLVYAPVLRGIDTKFGMDRVKRQLTYVAERALIVWVTAEEEILADRLRERGDDLIDESMLHAILKNYWRWMSWWQDVGAIVQTVDTTEDFPNDLELQLGLSTGLEEVAVFAGK